jgi:hypothetical protein
MCNAQVGSLLTARLAHAVEEERRAIFGGQERGAITGRADGGSYYTATSHRPASHRMEERDGDRESAGS